MANLNLKEMKWIDENALRIIISTGLGFASRVQALENKEIEEFTADKLYEKGSKVLHNNYLWIAKVTNQSSTFNENYWTLVGDDITELTLDEIKTFLGLTQEQIDTLASIIVDTEIRLDKTWSSSKTYSDIQDAIKECKQYCLTELAKKSTGSFKKANSTSEVTDGNYLYLILNSSTNKYDIYALVDSNVELLTSVDVNLSDYYTKTEINNDFLKKTDATSTYATKTEANDKVDKTSILSSISSTATDDNLYSAKVINNELDKKFNKDNVLSVIQDTDNTKVFGAKATYDTFNQKADKINLYELKDANGKAKHIIIDLPSSHSISGKTTRLFFTDGILTIGLQIWNGSTLEKDFRVPVISPNHIYIPTKTITPVSSKVNFTNVDSSCSYQVINGMCYVNIWSMNITSNLSVETIFNNLPTAKASAQFVLSNDVGSKTVGMGWIGVGTQNIQCNAQLEAGTAKSQGYARFSYPIDESWIPS